MGAQFQNLCDAKGIELQMVEVDLLRDAAGKMDLLVEANRKYWEKEASTADIVLLSPPCATFSRAT
jgi:site-specific DNA-cytosine methylase